METPSISLGSEQLSSALLSEVDVSQRLNDHWTCRIVLRDTPDRRPAVEDYAGKELKISTTELDGTETIIFHGLVRGMRLIYEITGAWGAELEAVSGTWKMAQGTRLKYFRQQSAQASAQAVISGAGLQMGGAMPAGATLSYVQWDETDYSFFSRLVDDTEAWFRPAIDGSGGVDVETAFQSGTTVNWREGEYGLLEWTTQGLLQPVTASGANYDPQKMQSTVAGGTTSSVSWYGGAADKMVAAAQTASGGVESAWVDRHRAATLDDLNTRMQREARRGLANTVRCTGISRNPKVRAGDTLQVTGLPGVDATYGVVEVRHAWTTQGYENHFTVTPAQRWSPPVRPARPMLDGIYPARVVDNHDPHNQGRIRVQYYWQEDNQSTWVRLLTPHAGAGRGMLFLPELGDEVLVTFEEGDAERPYVVGSAWNGVHQPPATGFHSPGETNGSEFAKNDIKRIVTKSGHRITLVDTPGKETISIATPTSNRLMLTESHADTGGRPAIVLESAGDIVMAAPNGRIHTQSMHRSAEVGNAAAALLSTVSADQAEAKRSAATKAAQHTKNAKLQAWRKAHQVEITRALANQRELLLARQKQLTAWDAQTKANARKWFGSDSPETRKALLDRTNKELTLNEKMQLDDFRPADPPKPGTFAYVYPNDPDHQIYLDSAFESAPQVGTDSKAGTLSHEMSHFTRISGTKDIVYGQAKCLQLAKISPAAALQNADSYEYFVENVH